MSHDTDKLIRQLSLVAFLMAERRPLTARDVKQNVEGYSEMSDEAFARRFYSDRAELLALGVPLESQRDEFTGEELYTLRSEQYFLPPLELSDDELAALQTCLYLLEGKFAYAEPLRLALQNLALGRPGLRPSRRRDTAVRVEVVDPDYSAEMPGRLGKLESGDLEAAHRQVRLLVDLARQASRSARSTRTRCSTTDGGWYVVGHDLEREAIRTFRVSRIRGDIRFATRRERDFRLPAEFDDRGPPRPADRGRSATSSARRGSRWRPTPPGGSSARSATHGRFEDDVFVTPYASSALLASWVLRQDGRAVPLEPDELRREVAPSARAASASATRARRPSLARRDAPRTATTSGDRPAGPGRARALRPPPGAARLPARRAAATSTRARRSRRASSSSASTIPRGGARGAPRRSSTSSTSAAAATRSTPSCSGDAVHVDKELFGDTFRSAPRLTPLEARAIRLALEFVGPMIAADAHTPLERVRRKLEETFGQFELAQTPSRTSAPSEEDLVATLSAGDPRAAPRRDRVPEGGRGDAVDARRRAVRARARAAALVRPHVGSHARRRAQLPARPDAHARS